MGAVLTVDLGFGDAGKGSVVDYLVRKTGARTVVRYNGGPQAAHRVVTPDGKDHVFAQFGSGTFAGARTFLSRFMLVNPLNLATEARHLEQLGVPDPFDLLYVDADALVISPFQVAANRVRETARGRFRHGSCGQGVGEAVHDSLENPELAVRVEDLRSLDTLRAKFSAQQELKRPLVGLLKLFDGGDAPRELTDPDAPEIAAAAYASVGRRLHLAFDVLRNKMWDEPLVFEGAQGVLLDEGYGFHPYTTWSNTTLDNAKTLCEENDVEHVSLGILRSYAVRHGPGPFPTESEWLSRMLPDESNGDNPWQGKLRVGHFDTVLARYALDACPVDSLAVTCLDRMIDAPAWAAVGYRNSAVWWERVPLPTRGDLGEQKKLGEYLRLVEPVYTEIPRRESAPYELPEDLAESLNLPLALTSWGPTAEDKVLHKGVREWLSSASPARS